MNINKKIKLLCLEQIEEINNKMFLSKKYYCSPYNKETPQGFTEYIFSDKDIKVVENTDIENLLEYDESYFLNKINQLIKFIFDLSFDIEKLKTFNSNFKEVVIYENNLISIEETEEISVILYKNNVCAYSLENRGKRDYRNNIYWESIEVFKEIIKDYIECCVPNDLLLKSNMDITEYINNYDFSKRDIQIFDLKFFKETSKFLCEKPKKEFVKQKENIINQF